MTRTVLANTRTAKTPGTERLLRVLFGKKAEDVQDVSLRVDPGISGKVLAVRTFVRREKLTEKEVKKRKEEGCIVVEMELAACQAVANHFKLELYDFLQPGDVLIEGNYDKSLLHSANHDLIKLDIGLKIIEEI